jgi:hypothetical protein
MATANVTVNLQRSIGSSWPSEEAIAGATVAFLNGAKICLDGQESSETNEASNSSEGSIETLETLFESIRRGSKTFPNSVLLEMEGAGRSVDVENDENRYRSVLRGLFCAFAQDAKLTREHLLDHEIVWHLQGDTFFRATGISHNYQLNNYQNVVSVGSALLLDPKKGIGQKLCQCHLLICRKFFFEIQPPRGRPKRRYCSHDHLDESHKANAANRTKISRENKKRREAETERLRTLGRKKK